MRLPREQTQRIHLWKIDVSPPALVAQLGDRNCKTAVRQTEISPDGKTVLAACDGGTLWRWDFVDRDALANATVGGAVEEKEEKEDVVIIDEDKVDVVVMGLTKKSQNFSIFFVTLRRSSTSRDARHLSVRRLLSLASRRSRAAHVGRGPSRSERVSLERRFRRRGLPAIFRRPWTRWG